MKNFAALAFSSLLLAPLPVIALGVAPLNAQAPLPPPLLTVSPLSDRISIEMINETGATIDYEVIRDTQYRSIGGNSEITLRGLSTPTTLTFRRQDGGLLQANLRSTQAGVLELRLSATTDFSRDRTTLTIDEVGGVSLN